MCWITKQKWRTRPRIAKRRIEVWKVYTKCKFISDDSFCINGASFTLRSPYMNMLISKRMINSVLHSYLDCPIQYGKYKRYKIECGYHSFKKGSVFSTGNWKGYNIYKGMITTSSGWRFCIIRNSSEIPIVMKCWIPVGAEYYVNEKDEYVSNKIIIEDEIPYNKLPIKKR